MTSYGPGWLTVEAGDESSASSQSDHHKPVSWSCPSYPSPGAD
jgi:hypothetical protein